MTDNVGAPKGNTEIPTIRTISVFGLTESGTREHLSEFGEQFPEITLELQAEFPEIRLKLCPSDAERDKQAALLEDAVRWACRRLGDYVFSDTGESMAQVVGTLLRRKNATLAVAESCTGGLIADLLTDVPGSSDYFLFSAVTYANQAKMKILTVRAETLEKYGAVSEPTAGEMARGAKNVVDATYGLATSGIAGPGGGTDDKPVGTVCIGLATPSSVSGHRFHFTHYDRRMNKHIFAITALDLLRKELLNAK
jgi:nicotinamide-nucleotide amidase